MNMPETSTSLFSRLRFILVETSRAGNVGSVARAMKISFAAATHRFNAWSKAGGMKRNMALMG